MRKVCRLAREVLDLAAAELRPGVTTDYVDEVVHKACIERDVCATWGDGVCVCNEKRSELTLAIVVSFAFELYELPEVSLYVD